MPVYAAHDIVAIGTSVTGDSTTTAGAMFFRTTYSASEVGESVAGYLRLVPGGTQAIVLFKDDGYGQPVAAGFKRGAERTLRPGR